MDIFDKDKIDFFNPFDEMKFQVYSVFDRIPIVLTVLIDDARLWVQVELTLVLAEIDVV